MMLELLILGFKTSTDPFIPTHLINNYNSTTNLQIRKNTKEDMEESSNYKQFFADMK